MEKDDSLQTYPDLSQFQKMQSRSSNLQRELTNRNNELADAQLKQLTTERALREAQFQALSCQINPHFLFNVLNTLGRLAYLEKARRTEVMLYDFADMMRYLLRKNNRGLITLKQEIDYLNSYIAIQSVRMRERFDYRCDIPEKYFAVVCPFLILQPLVENFFNYVVEPREVANQLTLRASDDGQEMVIEVTDNGDGISAEKISKILSGDEHRQHGGIGLHNIKNRLQLLFGERYTLEILSPAKPLSGTTIKLHIPLKFPQRERADD